MDGRRRYIRDDQNGLPRSPGLPRGVRPQRSMVDVSTRSKPSRRDWNDAPSLPQSSSHSRGYNSEIRPPITPPNRVSKVSLESASSHGSSTFSREQAYESSTSVDEPPLSKSAHREWASSRNRQRSSGFTAELSPHDGNVIDPRQSSAPHRIAYTTGDIGADDTTMIDGYGASLWNRIATAANSLTINVSKAWAAGLFTEDGQVTPPEGETRLTRALKSYHLNNARTTAELPPWLFSEEERRVSRSRITHSHPDEDHEAFESEREMRMSKPRNGLRDIYADVNARISMSDNAPRYHSERGPVAQRRVDDPELRNDYGLAESYNNSHQTKASSRLQAMRAARRPNRLEQQQETVVGHADELRRDNGGRLDMRERRREGLPLRRVGLPTGPRL